MVDFEFTLFRLFSLLLSCFVWLVLCHLVMSSSFKGYRQKIKRGGFGDKGNRNITTVTVMMMMMTIRAIFSASRVKRMIREEDEAQQNLWLSWCPFPFSRLSCHILSFVRCRNDVHIYSSPISFLAIHVILERERERVHHIHTCFSIDVFPFPPLILWEE